MKGISASGYGTYSVSSYPPPTESHTLRNAAVATGTLLAVGSAIVTKGRSEKLISTDFLKNLNPFKWGSNEGSRRSIVAIVKEDAPKLYARAKDETSKLYTKAKYFFGFGTKAVVPLKNQPEISTEEAIKILGVDPKARPGEIKAAYLKIARDNHPDKNPNGDTALFDRAHKAYQVLANSSKPIPQGLPAKVYG